MKNILFYLIVFQAFVSCQKGEGIVPEPKLLNCHVGYLNFVDDVKYNSKLPGFYDDTLVNYQYLDGKVSIVKGGLIATSGGSNFSNCKFSSLAYDSITYNSNIISVYTKPRTLFYLGDNSLNPSVYILDNQERLQKFIRRDGVEFNYTYLENQVIEKLNNGRILRNFYFENNNLVKVLKEYYDINNELNYKKEILFQKYDNHPNPFKNKFYLTGSFYNAFSENNYTELIVNEYGKLLEGTFGILTTYKYSLQLFYENNDYPKFGEYLL